MGRSDQSRKRTREIRQGRGGAKEGIERGLCIYEYVHAYVRKLVCM